MQFSTCGIAATLLISLPAFAASPEYVAFGSSYAAGIGLGDRVEGTPKPCMRGTESYPHIIANSEGFVLKDATCSGSTVTQILDTGQSGIPPQIDALDRDAALVTITAGGNDLDYAGDMMRSAGLFGGLKGPLVSADKRPFDALKNNLVAALRAIHRRAPNATIILTTYPDVLPASGTCPALSLDNAQAELFRRIAKRLARVTRQAGAIAGHVVVVDIAKLSKGHDACSNAPWTTGAKPAYGFPFHPNAAGAVATAAAIMSKIRFKNMPMK